MFCKSTPQSIKKYEINTSPEGLYGITAMYNYEDEGFFFPDAFIKVTDTSYNIIRNNRTCIIKKDVFVDDISDEDGRIIRYICSSNSKIYRITMIFSGEFPDLIKIYDSKGNVIVFQISEVYIFTT
jgi:hypothetical protein